MDGPCIKLKVKSTLLDNFAIIIYSNINNLEKKEEASNLSVQNIFISMLEELTALNV